MNETLDGEFQKFSVAGGGYIREHFFGPDPRLAQARRAPVRRRPRQAPPRRPRLPQGLRRVQGRDRAHRRADGDPRPHREGLDARTGRRGAQHHPPGQEAQRGRAQDLPRPPRAADPRRHAQGRAVLPPGSRLRGGPVPPRAPPVAGRPAAAPDRPRRAAARARRRRSTRSSPRAARRPVSTTMVFARILRNLIRDPELGPRIVPIIPDEARTFGMDPLFKEVGIYSALGQRYEPVDSDLVLSYREATDGQVLEEGITEAGSMASFQAAGTSYASHGVAIIPFYIFYSMFGFQRTGDQMWAFGDARGRGFLMGATAGRTTLTGEGLQHDDGQTQILASTVPNLRAYDPAFAYELAAVVRDGIERMYGAEARGRLLLRHDLQRELRPAGPARGPDRRGHPARRLPLRGRARPRPRRPPGPAGRLGLDPPAGPRRARPAGREVRRGGRGLQRPVVPAAAPRRARGRALEPPPSGRQDTARPARQPRSCRPTAGRSSPRPTG